MIISRTTEKNIVSFESPSKEIEKKNAPPLPPKASVINEKSKSSPSSKNLKKELEENIQLKPLQPVLRYGLIFAKNLFKSTPKPKLYIPSTPNIDLIQWHTHWIVCAVK